MARTPSSMVPLGTSAPNFLLPDTNGRMVTIADFDGAPGLLVMFICNHCPFVVHVRDELARLGKDCAGWGVGVVAINSNDAHAYPADNPEAMKIEREQAGYSFPYVFDETQEVARAYGATCTPDFFLYDGDRKLVYRGQLDASRPGNNIPVDGSDLRAAIRNLLDGKEISADQKGSLGCNIKWKPGNEPGEL